MLRSPTLQMQQGTQEAEGQQAEKTRRAPPPPRLLLRACRHSLC